MSRWLNADEYVKAVQQGQLVGVVILIAALIAAGLGYC
jgi:hypothetical protein